MTLGAGDRQMLPLQRIARFAMVKIDGVDQAPSVSGVTG